MILKILNFVWFYWLIHFFFVLNRDSRIRKLSCEVPTFMVERTLTAEAMILPFNGRWERCCWTSFVRISGWLTQTWSIYHFASGIIHGWISKVPRPIHSVFLLTETDVRAKQQRNEICNNCMFIQNVRTGFKSKKVSYQVFAVFWIVRFSE